MDNTLNIRQIRSDYKLSQKDIANIVGCRQGFVSQVENGVDPMPSEWAKKIADSLNISDIQKYYKLPIQSVTGNGNHDNNMINSCSSTAIEKLIDEMAEQRKSYTAIIDKLIEKISK